MIAKLSTTFLIGTIAFAASPNLAVAQSSDQTKKKVQRFLQKLKKLPNGAAPAPKVRGLAGKLVTLDVKRAVRYYRIAVIKFTVEPGLEANARQLETFFDRVFKKAANRGQISSSLSKKLQKSVSKIEQKIKDPTPTPTPYQALRTLSLPEIG